MTGTEIIGLVIAVFSIGFSFGIYLKQRNENKKSEKRQKDFSINHLRPLYNQINSIAKKLEIDDELKMDDNGQATRLRPTGYSITASSQSNYKLTVK